MEGGLLVMADDLVYVRRLLPKFSMLLRNIDTPPDPSTLPTPDFSLGAALPRNCTLSRFSHSDPPIYKSRHLETVYGSTVVEEVECRIGVCLTEVWLHRCASI